MKIRHAIGGIAIIAFTFTIAHQPSTAELLNHQSFKIAQAVTCSPIKGTWFHSNKGIPVSLDRNNRVVVNMSAFRRPTATGRILSPTQIEVTFPDDATFVGTLNGEGQMSWNNGTVWEATQFAGSWKYEGKYGPKVQQLGDQLQVGMSKYNRPTALGSVTAPGKATVNFTDDAIHTATLIGPNCMKWSNGTTWTK